MATDQLPSRSNSHLGSTIEEKTRTILGWTASFTPTCAPPMFPSGIPACPPAQIGKTSPTKKDRARKPKTPQRSAPYPYSLVPEGRSRKSSVSSVSSSSSSGGDSLVKQQLTPPPSPAATSATTNASVTIVSLPRTAQTRMAIPAENRPNSDAYGPLPISPVSPNTPNPYANLAKPTFVPPTSAPSQQVFERIRELIPNMPADKNAYRVLVQTATSVIELEHKLENIIQEKQKYKSMLENRRQQQQFRPPNSASPNQSNCRMATHLTLPTYPSNPVLSASCCDRKDALPSSTSPSMRPVWEHHHQNCAVPEDLLHVDVSAFKHLVASPTDFDTGPTTGSRGNWDSIPGHFDFDLVGNSFGTRIDPLNVDTAPSTAASFC